MTVRPIRLRRTWLCVGLLCALAPAMAQAPRSPDPNTAVPSGAMVYAPGVMPDRIVATPAADARTGFSVAWRTAASVQAPWLEIAVAGDSPDLGLDARRVQATTTSLATENGLAHHHRADVQGLAPGTLYAWRVQGQDTWSPWMQLRTAAPAGEPLTLLYFGDTQNQNLSLTSRVTLEALRHAPDARLAIYAGDLVSGGDGEDDNEWGEWFDAVHPLPAMMLTAPALGNHEYWEEFEDTPQERRVLGEPWQRNFALPGNGAAHPHAVRTTYWFDMQGARFVVLDGTSALDLDSAPAQAQWLDAVLSDNPNRWTIALIHQPMYSPRQGRDNASLREHLLPVLERHQVDLVLQGHDHTYGRRAGDTGAATPQYIVSVAGAKQYRLSQQARQTMQPVAEDTQLFQVIRLDEGMLRYESRTATGQLYDAFELQVQPDGGRRLVEIQDGRIAPRDCEREATLKGRTDRCWE